MAGKRAGLAGERSGLFMEQIRVIKEMRNECIRQVQLRGSDEPVRPRYMIWENVPGAFSSNKGEDFKAVLEETAKVAKGDACIPGPPGGKWPHAGCIMGDGWSIAWRVHDAQYWGVPQRRKRIALVADFGGTTAPEILFERKGVSRDITQGGKEGEGTAADVRPGIKEAGGAIVYGISGYDSNAMKSDNPHAGIYEAETSRTLDVNGGSPACHQGGMAVVSMQSKQQSMMLSETTSGTLGANDYKEPQVVCVEGNGSRPSHQGDGYAESETMYTLNSTEHHAVAYRKQAHPHNTEEGQGGEEADVNDTLNAFDAGEARAATIVLENHPADSRLKVSEDGMVQTLSGRMGTGGGNVPMVMEQTVSDVDYEKCWQDHEYELAPEDPYEYGVCLKCPYFYPCTGNPEPVCIGNGQAHIANHLTEGVSQTLNCMHDPMAVMVGSFYPQMKAESQCWREDDVSNTLVNGTNPGYQNGIVTAVDCRNGTENESINGTLQAKSTGGIGVNFQNVVRSGAVVRRLTPLECTRLQGFPDGWVDIGEWTDSKGKKHKDADAPKYKALGNSIALPFWEWMAKRMVQHLGEKPTMASLFSGIGGFELVFARAGCKPVWASEVEEFAIAVTKIRFPD